VEQRPPAGQAAPEGRRPRGGGRKVALGSLGQAGSMSRTASTRRLMPPHHGCFSAPLPASRNAKTSSARVSASEPEDRSHRRTYRRRRWRRRRTGGSGL